MFDPRVDKLAQILVNYSTEVRPGDWVLVAGEVEGLPLISETVKHVLRAGGHPTIELRSDDLEELKLREGTIEQIEWLSPIDEAMADKLDVRIVIRAASNTRALMNLGAEKQQARSRRRGKILRPFMQRTAEGTHRWATTNYPTPAFAQDADMSLREYEDFVYAATYADQPDPVKCWKEIHDMQQKLIDWLAGKDRVEVWGPNIDLSLSIRDRIWINSDGKRNMPSGEIFTGPIEESVNGWVKFTYPAVNAGNEVEGVEFRFENGRVADASAQKNEEYLLSQLNLDEGARYLGEFAVGTNYQIQKFTKSILYDEKIGGTVHMAVGAGYPETGSQNKSIIHWDFICDMRQESEILVDGELFYRNGEFQI